MNYENFLQEAKKIAGKYHYKDKVHDWTTRKPKDIDPYIFVEWETGGVNGGSCWDSSNPTPYTLDNPPEELHILDAILEKYRPNITYLEYKNLSANIMEYDSRTEREYYGNSTNYAIKKVLIKDLYNYLIEKGWLEQ